jgi:3-oxoadipate enol-lactonase
VAEPDRQWETMQVEGPAGHLCVKRMHPGMNDIAPPAVVVFLHPVNLTAQCWVPVAQRLRDVSCVLIDSRGHGRSHMNGSFDIEDYSADVVAVLEALELRFVHLVGGSLGGTVACAVAAGMPDRVRSLAALGSSLEPAEPDELAALEQWREAGITSNLFYAFLEAEMQHGLSPTLAADARRQVGLEARSSELIKNITWSAFAADARRYAPAVRCPALVLTGEHDASCPPATGARMAAALGARFEILPGLGHLAMMQAPVAIAERLTRFFAEVIVP